MAPRNTEPRAMDPDTHHFNVESPYSGEVLDKVLGAGFFFFDVAASGIRRVAGIVDRGREGLRDFLEDATDPRTIIDHRETRGEG